MTDEKEQPVISVFDQAYLLGRLYEANRQLKMAIEIVYTRLHILKIREHYKKVDKLIQFIQHATVDTTIRNSNFQTFSGLDDMVDEHYAERQKGN